MERYVLVDQKDGDVVSLCESLEGVFDCLSRGFLGIDNEVIGARGNVVLANACEQETGSGVLIADDGDEIAALA